VLNAAHIKTIVGMWFVGFRQTTNLWLVERSWSTWATWWWCWRGYLMSICWFLSGIRMLENYWYSCMLLT